MKKTINEIIEAASGLLPPCAECGTDKISVLTAFMHPEQEGGERAGSFVVVTFRKVGLDGLSHWELADVEVKKGEPQPA